MKGLVELLGTVAGRLVMDSRWVEENDDLGVEVSGMLLYGLAFSAGRSVFFMDDDEIHENMRRMLVDEMNVAEKWAAGLVKEAGEIIFDRQRHPICHDLIGIGHRYFGKSTEVIVENIYENIGLVRLGMELEWP